jgi:outer membrane protein OmpA-like peptidoglycan-associated protein
MLCTFVVISHYTIMKRYFLYAVLLLPYFVVAQSAGAGAKKALLKGLVTNFKGKPLANEIIMFSNDANKAMVTVHTDDKGKFEVQIPVNATYSLKYKTFTSEMDYTKMEIPDDADATYEVLVKIDPPLNVVLDNVYFDTGRSTLKPSSNKALNDLAMVLKLKSTMEIEIQGHTDDVGAEGDNMRLSQSRAEEVRKYLISKGISAARISARGFGSLSPITENSTPEGKAKNRRTSLKVLRE